MDGMLLAGIVEPVFAEYIGNLADSPAGLDAADNAIAAGAKVCLYFKLSSTAQLTCIQIHLK